MKYSLTSLFLVVICLTFAQVDEDFSDGDFSANPVWVGSDTIFNIDTERLRLNATVAGQAYLSTTFPITSLNDKEWRVWVKQSFAPSSNNNSKFYLAVNNADLSLGTLSGYYLQLGEAGSGDAVRLMYENSGVSTEICAATAGQIASSFEIAIKVTRDNLGNWSLFVDPAGGDNYNLEGTGTENSITTADRIGLFCLYTVGNISKFYFDDIYFGAPILDLDAPEITDVSVLDQNNLDLQFSEALQQLSAENVLNYVVNNGIGSPNSATLDGTDPSLVHLTFTNAFANGVLNTINVTNVQDLSANTAPDDTTFMYFIPDTPVKGDVLITEFMCDPTPTVGLKDAEFVELYNRSNKIFDLSGWKLGDASSDGTIGSYVLAPNSYVILTSNSNIDSFSVANVVGVSSFPSLNNSGDNIVLRSDIFLTIDSLSYTDDWYRDDNKTSGGWTIELINVDDPCSSDDNWTASNDANGGTPGMQNSVYDNTPDTEVPTIVSCAALDEFFVEVYFSEGMDSVSLQDNNLTVNPNLTISNRYVLERYPNKMTLNFSDPIQAATDYVITLENGTDCWGNAVNLSCSFVLPELPDSLDLVINEVLFNPLTGSEDFVEIYNNSDKYVNLQNCMLATLDADTVADNEIIISNALIIPPNSYRVLTEDTTDVKTNYPNSVPGTFIQMDQLPTYSNEEGSVVLLDALGNVLDLFNYDEDMHLAILDDEDGKTLERLDPNRATNDEGNWHTAAEQVGWATPGAKNSQFLVSGVSGDITLTPALFSPDSDGIDDNLNIDYQLEEEGFIANITIYDAQGRQVRELKNNELLGTSGTFTWDGINDRGEKTRVGTYIVLFKAFNSASGNKVLFKKVCVIASKQ